MCSVDYPSCLFRAAKPDTTVTTNTNSHCCQDLWRVTEGYQQLQKYTANSITIYMDFALIASTKTPTLATVPGGEKGYTYLKKELTRPAPSPRKSHLLVTPKQLKEH